MIAWKYASSTYGLGALVVLLHFVGEYCVLRAIGSSDKVHVVDALAITGEEGRASLREVPGSWQWSIDPGMSEWGNPLP